MDHSISLRGPKHGSHIQFGKINKLAEMARCLQAIWNKESRLCRYRAGAYRSMVVDSNVFNQQICERTPGKPLICGWQHCTVDEHTIDKE